MRMTPRVKVAARVASRVCSGTGVWVRRGWRVGSNVRAGPGVRVVIRAMRVSSGGTMISGERGRVAVEVATSARLVASGTWVGTGWIIEGSGVTARSSSDKRSCQATMIAAIRMVRASRGAPTTTQRCLKTPRTVLLPTASASLSLMAEAR